MIELLIILSLLTSPSIEFETEFGEPHTIEGDCILIVVDGQSCALCTEGTLNFIDQGLPDLTRYIVIDDQQPRSFRSTHIARYQGFIEAFSPEAVLYTRPGEKLKEQWCGQYTQTPFVLLYQDSTLTPFVYSDGTMVRKKG